MWEHMQIQWRPSEAPPRLAPSDEVEAGREPEWLVTNGIGGFGCGTVLGIHRRRYHGLLVASLQPPVRRHLMWVKNDETVVTSRGAVRLGTNDYGDTLHPEGWKHIHSFSVYPFPTTRFLVQGMELERSVFMVHGQNTTVLLYRLLTHIPDMVLHIEPLVNFRDYHHTTRDHSAFESQQPWSSGTALRTRNGGPQLILGAGCADGARRDEAGSGPRLRYERNPMWYRQFHYAIERQRGLDYVEDHLRPGTFYWRPVGPGDTLAVVGHCTLPETEQEPPWGQGGDGLLGWALRQYEAATTRRRELLERAGADGAKDVVAARLVVAADDFIVHRRTTNAATIVAGYPWFTDWGRDAMISLPGLLLRTGRWAEAKEVLLTFAAHRAEGLIPNRFPDDGAEPLYNTVDASLWFFWAAWHYAQTTNDRKTVQSELLPVMQDIIAHYLQGTRHGIGTDPSGLVHAADPGLQLTWMDAKAGDWVVTPRAGAPVEINALWYNALRTVAMLARTYGAGDGQMTRPGTAPVRPSEHEALARKVRRAFVRRFVRRGGGLYDVVPPAAAPSPKSVAEARGTDASFRSNQIFAASLPFTVLTAPHMVRVLREVARDLLTPVGLRTLAATDPAYIGRYGGDQRQRDAAYHRGTVWPWLLGAFVDAWRKVGGDGIGVRKEPNFFGALEAHMQVEGALGHVSEIFAGDAPHGARGCFAQAWSVAEWLRVKSNGLKG